MKTIKLKATSYGKAMQEVFLRTNVSMFPRSVKDTWCYDEREPSDASCVHANGSILSPSEIVSLHLVCDRERYNPNLWNILISIIIRFPNQKRFYKATFLQPIVIAQAFYALTLSKINNN